MLFIVDPPADTLIDGETVQAYTIGQAKLPVLKGAGSAFTLTFQGQSISGVKLAEQSGKELIYLLVPDAFVQAAEGTIQFLAHSWTDLLLRGAVKAYRTLQQNSLAIPTEFIAARAMMQVEYQDGENVVTAKVADLPVGATWKQGRIPLKWFGVDTE